MTMKILATSLFFAACLLGCSSVKQDLGVDIYPGATKKPNASMTGSAGGAGMSTVTYATPDEQSKVAQFYKDRYKQSEPREMSFGGNAITIITQEDAKSRMAITVGRKSGEKETTILIMSGKQDEK